MQPSVNIIASVNTFPRSAWLSLAWPQRKPAFILKLKLRKVIFANQNLLIGPPNDQVTAYGSY